MVTTSHSTAGVWAGRVLSLLVVVALFGVAANMLLAKTTAHAQLAATGFPDSAGALIGITAIVCAGIYAIPQTSVLGAILITGFLGGAICTHFRLGEMGSPPQVISLVLGVIAWGGLYLRFPEVRSLLPIRL
ncbi:MAG: DoxX family protein [Acetobacteraceae bacterium]